MHFPSLFFSFYHLGSLYSVHIYLNSSVRAFLAIVIDIHFLNVQIHTYAFFCYKQIKRPFSRVSTVLTNTLIQLHDFYVPRKL